MRILRKSERIWENLKVTENPNLVKAYDEKGNEKIEIEREKIEIERGEKKTEFDSQRKRKTNSGSELQ